MWRTEVQIPAPVPLPVQEQNILTAYNIPDVIFWDQI